jgi:hypothetical protein
MSPYETVRKHYAGTGWTAILKRPTNVDKHKMAIDSPGLNRVPLKAVIRVRIPWGAPSINDLEASDTVPPMRVAACPSASAGPPYKAQNRRVFAEFECLLAGQRRALQFIAVSNLHCPCRKCAAIVVTGFIAYGCNPVSIPDHDPAIDAMQVIHHDDLREHLGFARGIPAPTALREPSATSAFPASAITDKTGTAPR